jgi:hypothetical protein
MKLISTVEIPEYHFKLNYTDYTFWIGSCFAGNIGGMMHSLRFPCCVNPFGALYNPRSIASGLQLLLSGRKLSEDDLFEWNGLYHSFMFHSAFSQRDKAECLRSMNSCIVGATEGLNRSSCLFITFGSSHVFIHTASGALVGNCHKLPHNTFVRKRLTVYEIVVEYESLIKDLLKSNSRLKVVFSVSPVRYAADGMHDNWLSKARLLLAIDAIVNAFPDTCFYFPAYELLLDELRDYRFYDRDLCHPSEIAIEYIAEKYRSAFIAPELETVMSNVEKLNKAYTHRPINTDSEEYALFVENIERRERELMNKYPFLAPHQS